MCATTGGSEREVGGQDSGVRNTYISFVSELLSNMSVLVHWLGLKLGPRLLARTLAYAEGRDTG